jgi:protein O-mannosyl-transferase
MKKSTAKNQGIKQSKNFSFSNKQALICLASIIIITLLAYSNSFSNLFNYRDDDIYVLDNHLIRDLSWSGLKSIFTELYYNGHLPLTILSLAIDYLFWELNAFGYHITSFLLHAVNIFLVYRFINELSGIKQVALLTAFIFAVHPTGVQSVSWIAERKNVLYATFFLVSLIQYVKYVKHNSAKHFILSLVFFIFSVASKWAAYTLPVVLVAIDFYLGRRITAKNILEKSVFLIIPFFSYYLHINSGVDIEKRYTFYDRIFFGTYSYLSYIFKAILPFNLSTIYPYPKKVGNEIPLIFYWSFPAAIAILSLLFYRIYKYAFLRKEIIFGILFFTINIAMVLNVLMFIGGHEMMANRYGYISFIGIFFIVAHIIFHWWKQYENYRNIIVAALAVYFIFLSGYTFARNKVWYDTITIYNDALEKYPATPIAHLNKAKYYVIKKQSKEALDELNYCTNNFSYYEYCFLERAMLYFNNGSYENAKADFKKALSLNTNLTSAHNYLGMTEVNLGNYAESIVYFEKYASLNKNDAMVYNNMGYAYNSLNKLDLAEKFYNKSLSLDSTLLLAYLNRGWLYINLKKYNEAVEDFTAANKLDPKNALIYNNRGWAFYNAQQYEKAINDFNASIQYDAQLNYSYYNRALTYFAQNNSNKACEDLQLAIKLNHQDAANLYQQRCN